MKSNVWNHVDSAFPNKNNSWGQWNSVDKCLGTHKCIRTASIRFVAKKLKLV